MSANSFGSLFKMTSFGESHGPGLGVVIEGCPSGIHFDSELLRKDLERRRPGASDLVSARNEADEPIVMSGIHQGKTLGTPIAVHVLNQDHQSKDYEGLSGRPGHADDVWKTKFGHTDHFGGGRASGRETLSRVIAGSFAEMFNRSELPDYSICVFSEQIGEYKINRDEIQNLKNEFNKKNQSELHELIDQFPARFPSKIQNKKISELLLNAKSEGKSFGGVARVWIRGLPAGLGQPVFRKFKSDLACALMSIGATCGIEFGDGFDSVLSEGSVFHSDQKDASKYGGIRGGITTGECIDLRLAFKPTSSVMDVAKKGRHDPCIVPRAVPVVEAMVRLVIADHLLWRRCDQAL